MMRFPAGLTVELGVSITGVVLGKVGASAWRVRRARLPREMREPAKMKPRYRVWLENSMR
jgi:hypothetical protein